MSTVQLSLDLAAKPATAVTARYAAFMQATGRVLPGSTTMDNAEFIIWVRRKWAEWGKAFSRTPQALSEADHAHFDAWLSEDGAQ